MGIGEGEITCDAVVFESACTERRWAAALEVYRGGLLDGFFVGGAAPELEEWLSEEQRRLRQLAIQAARSLTLEAEEYRNLPLARHWAHHTVALAPLRRGAIRCKLSLMERVGDRVGALLACGEFVQICGTSSGYCHLRSMRR